MNNQEFVVVLREVADFFEKHPELPAPPAWLFEKKMDGLPTFEARAEPEDFFSLAKHLSPCEKANLPTAEYFSLIKRLPHCVLEFWQKRDSICTRRVIGKKTVKTRIPVEFKEEEVEQEIFEWDCPESFLKQAKEVSHETTYQRTS